MKTLQNIFLGAADNKFIEIVLIAIVFDTIFGVLRAMKEHKFNSNFGIDGAIRKCGMIVSIFFFVLVDAVININLIGFIPETVRTYINISSIGMTEFFCLLYIAYEAVSVVKNMTLCGLPVKKIWVYLKDFLGKYTNELPDSDEAEENKIIKESDTNENIR